MAFRAVVLGGGGRMGSGAVKALVGHPGCAGVVVADARGERIRERLPDDPKVESVVAVDVTDRDTLRSLLESVDVAVNAVGPYYRFGSLVLADAIDVRCDYVDLCDDVAPTIDMLALDDRAADAGVRAVVGCGMSPGVTNMTVAWAAERLDVLREARMSWVVSMADAGGLAVGLHAFHMCYGSAQQIQGGEIVEVYALSRSNEVEFPFPYGTVEVFDVAHPEPVTLKARFPELELCWNRGAIYPQWAMDRLTAQAKLGLVGEGDVDIRGTSIPLRSLALALDIGYRSDKLDLPLGPKVSYDRIDISGERDRERVGETYFVPDEMSHGTGAAVAAGAALIAAGSSARPGVLSPEMAFSPAEFFSVLSDFGVHAYKTDLVSLASL